MQRMFGAGLDCIPLTMMLLLLLLLRADGTSQAREEEEDRRHGAVVTGIAVVRRFGIWESHGPVVSSVVVIVTLHRPKHVHSISMISDDGTCACRPLNGGALGTCRIHSAMTCTLITAHCNKCAGGGLDCIPPHRHCYCSCCCFVQEVRRKPGGGG